MSESNAYNAGAMRLLMTAALGVSADETVEDEAGTVSCPSQNVTVACDADGAAALMALAGARWTAVDQAFIAALATRDRAFEEAQRALAIAAQMAAAAENAVAEAAAGATDQARDEVA